MRIKNVSEIVFQTKYVYIVKEITLLHHNILSFGTILWKIFTTFEGLFTLHFCLMIDSNL